MAARMCVGTGAPPPTLASPHRSSRPARSAPPRPPPSPACRLSAARGSHSPAPSRGGLAPSRAASDAAGEGEGEEAVARRKAREKADVDLWNELGLKKQERIGSGARAVVHRAVTLRWTPVTLRGSRWDSIPPGTDVAVKTLVDESPSQKARIEMLTEAAIWEGLDHTNLVGLRYTKRKPQPVIVTELCPPGRLFDLIHRHRAPLDVANVALDIAMALEYMHNMGVAHRDIKSPNILLSEDPDQRRLVGKVCDLGSCSKLEDSVPIRKPPTLLQRVGLQDSKWSPIGTLFWIAPEMLEPPIAESAPVEAQGKCDVYSWATVVWEMLSRQVPWCDPKPMDIKSIKQMMIKEGQRPPVPDYVHPDVGELLQDCWAADPVERPAMEEVVARLRDIQTWDLDGRVAQEASEAMETIGQFRRIGLDKPPPPAKKKSKAARRVQKEAAEAEAREKERPKPRRVAGDGPAQVTRSGGGESFAATTLTSGTSAPRLRGLFAAVFPDLYQETQTVPTTSTSSFTRDGKRPPTDTLLKTGPVTDTQRAREEDPPRARELFSELFPQLYTEEERLASARLADLEAEADRRERELEIEEREEAEARGQEGGGDGGGDDAEAPRARELFATVLPGLYPEVAEEKEQREREEEEERRRREEEEARQAEEERAIRKQREAAAERAEARSKRREEREERRRKRREEGKRAWPW